MFEIVVVFEERERRSNDSVFSESSCVMFNCVYFALL